jgi:hypothetical protein
MWTAREHRRARFVREQEDYIRSCGLVNEGRVQEEWTRFVLAMMPPITFMGLFTFPEGFGGTDRRSWTLHHFLEGWCGQGHYLAAQEPHASGDVHFHVVGAEQVRRLSVMDAWKVETRGGLAWVQVPRHAEDAVGYCVKYVSKGYLSGQSELRLGEPASPPEAFMVRRGFRNPWRPRRPGEGL